MFSGCGTALVTPFRRDLSLDEATLRKLVRRQIEGGINFLVPCGTTGENPTMSRAEHLRVVEITIEEGKGKVPVLAGAGGYNTQEVIELAREIERLGANGILSVTPYYNKPTQEGLYLHFKAIAAAVQIPIIVYSVQGRTGVNVEPATLARLSQIENIVGHSIGHFSCPGGRYDRRTIQMAKDAGFVSVANSRFYANSVRTSSYELGRVAMLRDSTIEAFSDTCYGHGLWKKRLRYHARRGVQSMLGNRAYDHLRAVFLGGQQQ